MQGKHTSILFFMVWLWGASIAHAQPESTYTATTTANPEILVEQLELLLKPLYQEEVLIEALAWRELLKDKVTHISAEEIAVKQKNQEIKNAKNITETIEEAQDNLDKNASNVDKQDDIAKDLQAVSSAIKKASEHQDDNSLDEVVAKATEKTQENEEDAKEEQADAVVEIQEKLEKNNETDVTSTDNTKKKNKKNQPKKF